MSRCFSPGHTHRRAAARLLASTGWNSPRSTPSSPTVAGLLRALSGRSPPKTVSAAHIFGPASRVTIQPCRIRAPNEVPWPEAAPFEIRYERARLEIVNAEWVTTLPGPGIRQTRPERQRSLPAIGETQATGCRCAGKERRRYPAKPRGAAARTLGDRTLTISRASSAQAPGTPPAALAVFAGHDSRKAFGRGCNDKRPPRRLGAAFVPRAVAAGKK